MPTPACARATPGLALGMALRSVEHVARNATDMQRARARRGLRALATGALVRHAAQMHALCARGDRQSARALVGDQRQRESRTVGDPLPALTALWAPLARRRPVAADRSRKLPEARARAVDAARAVVALSGTSPPLSPTPPGQSGGLHQPRNHYVVRVPKEPLARADHKEEEEKRGEEDEEDEAPLVLHLSGLFGSHAAVFALGPHARGRYQRLFRNQEQATSVFQAVATHLARASAAGRDQSAAKRCGAVRGGMTPGVGGVHGYPRRAETPIPDDPLSPWVKGYGPSQQQHAGPAVRPREWVWGTRSEPDGGPGSLVFCKFDVAATYEKGDGSSPPLQGTAQTAPSLAIRSYAPPRHPWQTRSPPADVITDVITDDDTLPDKQEDESPTVQDTLSDQGEGPCVTGAFPVRARPRWDPRRITIHPHPSPISPLRSAPRYTPRQLGHASCNAVKAGARGGVVALL